MKEGDIITVVTVSGEYIGVYTDSPQAHNCIKLQDPRMIVQMPEGGGMGFAQGVAVTGVKDPTWMLIENFVFTTETNEQVQDAYRTAVSKIKVAPKNIIVDK